jgi:Uma2 family endonuclease
MTLEEFLRRTDIDEHPYLEYIDGRIEAKASPQKKHSAIQGELLDRFNRFAAPPRLGRAFGELRCTFAGRSIVPDVVFLLKAHIERDDQGELLDDTPWPPDIHVEIISPDQSSRKARDALLFSTAHGCPLGWRLDPYEKTIEVFRPGRPAERLAPDGVLEGEPVLPGFRPPATEVFGLVEVGPLNRNGSRAMASPPRIRPGMTIEEFLRWPDIDEHPYLEYIDGRIEAKVAPQQKHSRITTCLAARLDRFAGPAGWGLPS